MKALLRELKSTLQSHETLNPKLWKDEKLDPEVWQALNKIAKEMAKTNRVIIVFFINNFLISQNNYLIFQELLQNLL